MIRPQWVLIEDEVHHVSDYAQLDPGDRPPAFCPVCKRPVTMKLGSVRVHHYAHQPDDICAVTNSETALHLNLKMHIAEELGRNRQFLLENRCSRCLDSKPFLWMQDWDAVEVEYGLEHNFRPDVALIKDKKTIVAIEVHVTHAVEESKADYFERQGIAWIEVKGRESLYTGDEVWRAADPLPWYVVERCSAKLPRWMCVDCKKRAAREREERRYHFGDHAIKPVDIYWPDGGAVRYLYWIRMKYKDNEPIEAYLFAGKKAKRLGTVKPPFDKSLKVLNETVKKNIAYFREKKGAIVDEFASWQLVEEKEYRQWKNTELYPQRWVWSWESERWELRFVEKDGDFVEGPYRLAKKDTGEIFYLAAIENGKFIVADPYTGTRQKFNQEELEML